MIYKNMSRTTKTFYGVQFKPGEEHEVPGYINHPKFLRLAAFSPKLDESSNVVETTKKTSTSKTTKKEVTANGTDNNK